MTLIDHRGRIVPMTLLDRWHAMGETPRVDDVLHHSDARSTTPGEDQTIDRWRQAIEEDRSPAAIWRLTRSVLAILRDICTTTSEETTR